MIVRCPRARIVALEQSTTRSSALLSSEALLSDFEEPVVGQGCPCSSLCALALPRRPLGSTGLFAADVSCREFGVSISLRFLQALPTCSKPTYRVEVSRDFASAATRPCQKASAGIPSNSRPMAAMKTGCGRPVLRHEINRANPPRNATNRTKRRVEVFFSTFGSASQTIGATAIQNVLTNLNSLSRFAEMGRISPGRAVGPRKTDTSPEAKGMQATAPRANCSRPRLLARFAVVIQQWCHSTTSCDGQVTSSVQIGIMVSAPLHDLIVKDRGGVVHLSSDLIDTSQTMAALSSERMVAIRLRRAPFRLAESR